MFQLEEEAQTTLIYNYQSFYNFSIYYFLAITKNIFIYKSQYFTSNGEKTKNPLYLFDKKGFSLVAGVRFELTTFGL
jgi:hypothetical protein